MVANPIPEEFVGDDDFEGLFLGNGPLGGFEPGLKALAVQVFFEVLETTVPKVGRSSHPQTSLGAKSPKNPYFYGFSGAPEILSPVYPQWTGVPPKVGK
jgi:hypothetical protein